MTQEVNSRLNMWIRAFPRIAGGTAVVVGSVVLIGWMLDVPVLKSLDPSLVSMKANVALAFVLSGVSLLLYAESGNGKQRLAVRFLATMVLLIGLVTVAEYVFTWDAGIDQLLFNEPKGTIGTFLPGRMAFDTAMSFCLFGLAILLQNRRGRWSEGVSQVLALTVGAFGLLALVAYLYGLPGLSGYAVYVRMALHTSCTFILLSIGLTCLQPNVGVVAVIRGEGSGGFMARRLMPTAVVAPILLCWVVARGEMEGFYGNQFGDVIDATAYVAIALYVVWMIGRSLNKLDAERKQLEQSLLKSEREFKELFDNAPVGYHEVDGEGAFSRINRTELRMLGYQAEEMLGHFAWEFVGNQANSRDALLARLAGKRPRESGVERTFVRKDGTSITAMIEDQVVRDAQDRIIGLRATIQDVTELKRSQEHLRESEERFRVVVQTANDAILTVNQDGEITSWNEAAERTFGYASSDAVGKPVSMIMPERFRQSHTNGLNRFVTTGEPRVVGNAVELTGLRSDGTEFPVELSLAKMKTSGTTLFAGIIRDISERKRAEEALAAERLLLRTLIDNVPDTIYVKDFACRKTLSNPVDVRNMGASSEAEVLGKTDFDFYPHEIAGAFYADDQSVIQSGRAILNREEMITLPDKAVGWQLTSKVPLSDGAGQIIGLVGIGHDITERKLADKLAEALHSISQAIHTTDSLDQLFEHVHELLSGIILANNFFIALLTNDGKTLGIPYSRDEKHEGDWPSIDADDTQSLAAEVLRSNAPLLLNEKELKERYASGKNRVWGTAPKCWMGVPLAIGEKPIGVIAVQDYHKDGVYSPKDAALFQSAASQIALAIERKGAAKAVIASEAEFRRVWESTFDGMRVVDGEGTILMVNAAYCTMIGKGREELVGKPLSIITVESLQAQTLENHKQRFSSGTIEPRAEKELVLWNERRVWFEVSSSFLEIEGRPKGVLSIFRDVTGRKQAEDALAKKTELFRLVSNLTTDYIFVDRITDQGKTELDLLIGAVEQITGYTEEEYRTIGDWGATIHPDDREKDDRDFHKLLNNEKVVSEIRTIRKDGSTRWMKIYAHPIWDESAHKVIGISGAVQDITEKKRADQERESLIGELKTALENVRTLGGLVPICAHCKKIRDDKGYWNQLEKYLGEHTDAKLTHGLCPDCAELYFPGIARKI